MSPAPARVLRTDEEHAAAALFASTLHQPPPTDERWDSAGAAIPPGRTFGAFDEELIGTTRSIDTTLVVPGGRDVRNAAVTGVGVRSDRTRRGVLTELMRAQLADFADRGIITANLHASEGGIYGRFGYGPATYARRCSVNSRTAVLRDDLPAGGEVDRLGSEEAKTRLPAIYDTLPAERSGMLGRSPYTWKAFWAWQSRSDSTLVPVVHHRDGAADGFAVYEVKRGADNTELLVHDMHVGTVEAFTGLWRYLLGVDLVHEITLLNRPMDEPAPLLFTDPRAYREHSSEDETWLRLVDVPGALHAMRRGAGPLVVEVHDRMLEANSGRYLATPDAVSPTEEPADIRLDVDTLAMIYLGAWCPSALAAFGRIAHTGPDALAAADRLFAGHRAPWCGTFF